MTACIHAVDPWASAPQVVIFEYCGVLAAHGHSPVTHQAVTAVTTLAEHGVRLILASDTHPDQPRGVRTGQLRAAGISWCFDAVLESGHLGVRKPDPRFFEATLDQLRRLMPDGAAFGAVWADASAGRGIIPAIQYGLRGVWISHTDDPSLDTVPLIRRVAQIDQLPALLHAPTRPPENQPALRRSPDVPTQRRPFDEPGEM